MKTSYIGESVDTLYAAARRFEQRLLHFDAKNESDAALARKALLLMGNVSKELRKGTSQ